MKRIILPVDWADGGLAIRADPPAPATICWHTRCRWQRTHRRNGRRLDKGQGVERSVCEWSCGWHIARNIRPHCSGTRSSPATVLRALLTVACVQSSYALWAALQTRTRATDVRLHGVPAFLLDCAISSLSLLVAATTYSSHPILLNVLLLTPALFLYFHPPSQPPKDKRYLKGQRKKDDVTRSNASSGFNPFLTAYRGGMMAITCIAILAVDFKVFPRRFAKTETWGTSLVPLHFTSHGTGAW